MSDTNFLREIEEELRRDRLMKIWQQYGHLLVGAAVLVVLAVAGFRVWQWYEAREGAKAGARYEQAIDMIASGKEADAEQTLSSLAKDGTTTYRVLSRIVLAAQAGKKDTAAGVKAFDEIAADTSVDPVLRDLARLRAAYLLVDTAAPSEIAARVEPLTGTGATFRSSAKDALALSYFRAGDKAKARSLYNEILADPETPPALANRAQVILALTNGDEAAKPATTQ